VNCPSRGTDRTTGHSGSSVFSRTWLVPGSIEGSSRAKPVPAESRLIGANALREVPPADAPADTVRVRFLVASNGRVSPRTVRVSGTIDRHWIIRARGWLMRTRFAPTVRRQCSVPQWMDLTYAPRS
jgi:hypothetical protein